MNSFISLAVNMVIAVSSYGAPGETTLRTFDFDEATGTVVALDSLAGLSNPSFLAVADDRGTLLAVNENDGAAAGLTMLRRGEGAGQYTVVAQQGVEGNGPCHVAVSPDGCYAVTANYTGGSVSLLPFDSSVGTIGVPRVFQFKGNGVVPERQEAPHAHFTSFTPEGSMMIVDDLGTDRLHCFPLDKSGCPRFDAMTDVAVDAGSGPRHLVYDATWRYAYVINEIGGTVTQLVRNAASGLYEPKESVLADYEHGQGSGDIHLSPDGKFLYVSNRLKGDGIAVFSVDSETGALSPAGFAATGVHPRNFAISPSGDWVLVACRDDNRVEIYRRDSRTGALTHTGRNLWSTNPVCVLFIDTHIK